VELTKNILPNSLTVIGGPHTTFMPSETLKSSENLDVVVMGEGEKTMVDLANHSTESIHDLDEVRELFTRI
jgi:anaerobic magnesium-protoporphyrin IX monomethyl ester cyclase